MILRGRVGGGGREKTSSMSNSATDGCGRPNPSRFIGVAAGNFGRAVVENEAENDFSHTLIGLGSMTANAGG